MTPPPREPGQARPLVIYGAGGHGQVVAEAAALAGWTVLGFLDDQPPPHVDLLRADDPRLASAAFHVAIGDNAARQRVTDRLRAGGRPLAAVIHPAAFVSPTAAIADGAFVGPHAVVHAHAAVGRGAIVNSAAVVEHHCRIEVFAHVAPGAVLGGNVAVGERALVGLGARVLPGVSIAAGATAGAGAVVTRNVAAGATVVGVPAKPPRG